MLKNMFKEKLNLVFQIDYDFSVNYYDTGDNWIMSIVFKDIHNTTENVQVYYYDNKSTEIIKEVQRKDILKIIFRYIINEENYNNPEFYEFFEELIG